MQSWRRPARPIWFLTSRLNIHPTTGAARTVTLTINGTVYLERFSETVPNVSYIGFATQNAETLFTEPELSF